MSKLFITEWNKIQKDVFDTSISHGFWASYRGVPYKTIISEKLCLIHSEISEGLEAIREDDELGNLGEELADAVIRIMDLSERCNLNVAEELVKKAESNKLREYKHGKQL